MRHPYSFWAAICTVGLLSLASVLSANAGESIASSASSTSPGPITIAIPACQPYVLKAPAGDFASITWEVPDADVDVYQGKVGIVIYVPSPRRLPVIRRVTTKDGKQNAELIDLRVTGEQPGPIKPDAKPVVPDVKPVKPDTTPEAKLSPFAQRVYDEASKLPDPQRAEHARQIAESFKSVRARVAAGVLSQPGAVSKAIVEEYKKWPAAWSPWWKWWVKNGQVEWGALGMPPESWLKLIDVTCEGLGAVK